MLSMFLFSDPTAVWDQTFKMSLKPQWWPLELLMLPLNEVCVGGEGDPPLFIKRFGMNTLKEKPEKRQQKSWIVRAGSHTFHTEPHPWPGLMHKWFPIAVIIAQGVPVDGERQQRSTVSVQRQRSSVGLSVASVWTARWLLKQTELHPITPRLDLTLTECVQESD